MNSQRKPWLFLYFFSLCNFSELSLTPALLDPMLFGLRRLQTLSLRSILRSSTFSSSAAVDAVTSSKEYSIKALTKPQLETLVRNHFKGGKFSSLLQNVVALPSVLLTACRNLAAPPHSHGDPDSSSVSNWFDLEHLSGQLVRNEFDPGSCCVKLRSSSQNERMGMEGGEFLVLPNLKLKVVIEAVRMVLEVVYDDGFKTFVYGGRNGMGRHTAIRYLKNSIENPSWWFTVVLNRSSFDSRHVSRLCSVMGEHIDDAILIGLIERLFESEAVRIELGALYLGKGLPQESGLCSILLNVYLKGFDRSVQKIRLRMNDDNEKIKIGQENGYEDEVNLFYKPVKLYAVRYLDEMLMITSGSKKLTMDFKNWVCKYLEEKLELNVDRARTVIHSTVSEKIEFLGMELQAVPPSVLNPPMSEKAKRALKKHIRQKEVQALELKNARDRNRKMLGLKIVNHVFKKLKQCDGFKFDHQIENEVREIFRTWSDEVVRDFLTSVDERWEWHRHLTTGDFLSLPRIRKQLPFELVEAYDNFQEQVNRYLNPAKAKKALEEENRRAEEEEERKYSERTVKDLTKLSMKVAAPIELVRKAVKLAGFTNKMGRPRPISLLNALEDADIIKWYAGVGIRWLEFFSCCHNFKMVKTIVTYHLRFSCILTLAEKHESTKKEAMRHYTKDLKVMGLDGRGEEVYFPTEREVKKMGAMSLSDPKPVDGAIALALVRLASNEPSYGCGAHFCGRKDTTVYRVHLLQSRLDLDVDDEDQWVKGMASILDALNRKCLPLCPDHASEFYMARICLQDVDCDAFVDLD